MLLLGPQPWVQPLWRRGGNKHRAGLSRKAWNLGHLSTKCERFRAKGFLFAWRGVEQRPCPPLPAALGHCRSSSRSCNNCTERAGPLQSCCQVLGLVGVLRGALPAWALHTGLLAQNKNVCSEWHRNETLAQKLKHYHTYDSRIY